MPNGIRPDGPDEFDRDDETSEDEDLWADADADEDVEVEFRPISDDEFIDDVDASERGEEDL